MAELLQNEEVLRLLELSKNGLLFAIWETLYLTVISTFFSYVIGLPLGVITVVGEPGGVLPLPRPVMAVLNFVINILRSVPFLILMVVVIPLSRLILGTSIGTVATIVPLIVAAFPFVARLVESSLREVDSGVVEAAQSMGCSPFQVITKVMLPESRPSLISGFTTAFITILSYGAMAGAIGGGGLGKIAINYGYNKYNYAVMLIAVVLIVILVQIFQSLGTWISIRSDHRLTGKGGRSRRKKELSGQVSRDKKTPGAM